MSFLRQYVAPFVVILIFFFALFAVSIRIFLPSDMAAPAPISQADLNTSVACHSEAVLDRFWS